MIRLFIRAVSGRISQAMTDAKGMLVCPRATLEEIAERDDWAMPLVLLGLSMITGLPFVFVVQGAISNYFVTGLPATSSDMNVGFGFGFGFLSIPIFLVVVACWMRITLGKGLPGKLIRLLGFSVIPYLFLWLAAGLIIFVLFVSHTIPSANISPAWFVLIGAMFVGITTWSVWISFLMLRTIYSPASAANCFICLLSAIVVANIGLNTIILKAIPAEIRDGKSKAELILFSSKPVSSTSWQAFHNETPVVQAQPFVASKVQGEIRYDGIYKGPEVMYQKRIISRYLRFYQDGTVITVTSTARSGDDVEALAKWFDKNCQNLTSSHYETNNHHILFDFQFPKGLVKYSGDVRLDALLLECSRKNFLVKHTQSEEYEFIPWTNSISRGRIENP